MGAHPTPLPFKGKPYAVKSGDCVYIRSPRSVKARGWVSAVVRHWDEGSQTWRVQVVQPNLIETGWMASLLENKWKRRRKLTAKERERKTI